MDIDKKHSHFRLVSTCAIL